jgi:hypothetical protein
MNEFADATKLLVLIAIAAVIMFVARRFSESPSGHEFTPPEPHKETPPVVPVTGSEIPFPIDVRELESEYGSAVKRPRILNYWFRKTDLIAGPEDKNLFCDEFFMEMVSDDDGHRWTAEHLIATPRGLEKMMAENNYSSFFGDGMIVVPRYELAHIVRAVLERYMDDGVHEQTLENKPPAE